MTLSQLATPAAILLGSFIIAVCLLISRPGRYQFESGNGVPVMLDTKEGATWVLSGRQWVKEPAPWEKAE